MGKPQIKLLLDENYEDVKDLEFSSHEPTRPIENVHGEVAAMQMLIASRFSQDLPDPGMNTLADNMEKIVSSVSRMSGYVFLGLAVAGIILLIF